MKEKIIQCLAIEPDRQKQKELEAVFHSLSDHFQVQFSPSVVDTIETVNLSTFSVIIYSAVSIASSFPMLYEHLMVKQVTGKLIFLGTNLIPSYNLIERPGILAGTIEGTITPAELGGKIMTAVGHAFYQGNMTGMSFAFLFQLIELDKLTCALVLTAPDHKDEGFLFFRNRNLVNVWYGEWRGEDAVQEILSMKEPSIKMYNICPVSQEQLRINCSKLIVAHDDMKSDATIRRKKASSTLTTGLAGLFMKVEKKSGSGREQ